MSEYVSYQKAVSVSSAIKTRRSLRSFLPTPVATDTLATMLRDAARAPSGTNMQPWQSYVVTGQTLDTLCAAVCEAFDNPNADHQCETRYYPEKWFEPYLSRRREVGWDLYGLLGIEKGDRAATVAQHRRNFKFFDAPVGIIFTIHRDLSTGSWLDYGTFLQNVMLLARERGLHTCPQAAWADYHTLIRKVLPISEAETVVCGMAVGFADPEAIENSLVTSRVDNEDNVVFLD